jgi:hypothetical protein
MGARKTTRISPLPNTPLLHLHQTLRLQNNFCGTRRATAEPEQQEPTHTNRERIIDTLLCKPADSDGKIHDPQRIDYVARHLVEYERAINDSVKADGYFLWSIMDNFEWAWGYRQRFGIIFVDYSTGKRILKDSAHWYKDVIKSNGAFLHS